MDAVTHVLLAHAAALLLARGRIGGKEVAAAAGASALAPDLDVFLAPLTLFDSLYFLGHRGATHSLVGAPLSALAFLGLLHVLSKRFDRLALFRWRRGFWLAAFWGGWSHLALDGITRQGIVLFWPGSELRYSLEWFFYLIWWLAPVSFIAMLQRYRGKWGDKGYLRAVAVVCALILVVGAVRLVERPDAELVYPTASSFEWITADQAPNGTWHLQLVRGGAALDEAWYPPSVPPDAQIAATAATQSLGYRAFTMDGTGPFVAQATPATGGWNVTVIDAVARFQARDIPRFVPDEWVEDVGVFEATVTGSGVQVHRAGR